MKHFITFIVLCVFYSSYAFSNQIDLSGEWAFALDPGDVGITEQWYNKSLTGKIKLPGSLQEQGYGNDVDVNTLWTGQIKDSAWFKLPRYEKYRQPGNIKIPFWLQPEKHYVGVAWYQRKIEVPASWRGKHVQLELERPHWETTLFVNGKEIGKSNAMQTPHRYKIDETGTLMITIRIDNRVHIPVGINAHSVSDHTQSNWNGIVGNMTITARPALHIDNIQVYPDVKNRKVEVVVALVRNSSTETAKIVIKGESFNSANPKTLKTVNATIDAKSNVYKCTLDMGKDMLTWSEFEPNLYRLDVELETKDGKDSKSTTFGMREFRAEGTRFQINGTPVFLRGTLECAIFPLTGYASMDPDYWTKIYRRCKEFGLNHVRFHSWCPPLVAFEIADREGIYLQVECGVWTLVGDGNPVDEWLYAESERIIKEFGNHPSFVMMCHGNEPSGRNQTEYLTKFVDYWKAKDTRRVYTSGAGWPYIPNADFWNPPDPRIQGAWGWGLRNLLNGAPPQTNYDFKPVIANRTMPVISHEIGQWCVYPDFSEISKYTGVLKAKNFEIFKETLEDAHMGDLAAKFLYASGRLQTLCYKADIEAAFRTPGFGGFQLLDLHDFPGQGSALVGVLNPFWDTKGYVDGKEFSMFCNRTVPLARIQKFTWTNSETFNASLEISHFDKQPLKDATIEWTIADASGKTLASGKTTKDLPVDNCIQVADVKFRLSEVPVPSKLTLTVKVPKANAANYWDFWVYPTSGRRGMGMGMRGNLYFTTNYNDAIARAQAGANVLYCLPKDALKPEKGGNILVGFSSIFWNTAWFPTEPPHTLGILCDPTHPAFATFPNEGYSDYQWWDVVTGSQAIVMDDFPAGFRPLVHHIDDWFTNRKLGLLFETKVGKGKMMVCSADIANNLDQRIAARQFRQSIEQYMMSDKFNPAFELDLEIVKALLK